MVFWKWSIIHNPEGVCMLSHFSHVPSTIARQAPLSLGFPRQEYWSGLPFPPRGDRLGPRNGASVFCIGRWILYHRTTREAQSLPQMQPPAQGYIPLLPATIGKDPKIFLMIWGWHQVKPSSLHG